ncbi:hypothetical protein BLOT_011216 [Blomia tropicalis]|nr:hypothetical protein BLOT_011216 [Blomia tropicalis]
MNGLQLIGHRLLYIVQCVQSPSTSPPPPPPPSPPISEQSLKSKAIKHKTKSKVNMTKSTYT